LQATPPTPTARPPRRRLLGGLALPPFGANGLGDAIREARQPKPAVETRDRLYRRSLAFADVVAVCLALVVCVAVLGDDGLRWTTVLAVPLVVVVGKLFGLYDRDELLVRKTTIDETPQLFQLATLYALLFWLADDVLIDGRLGDTQVLVLWWTLFATALAGRRLARALARHGAQAERVLFVGDAGSYDRLRSKLTQRGLNAKLVGRLSLQRVARTGARTADEQELRQLIEWTDAHRVVIEPQTLPAAEMLDFVRAAKSAGVGVSLLPRVLDVVGTSVVFDDLHGVTLLGVRRFGLSRSSRLVKRAFDLAGALVCTLAALPVLAAIAVAIKLDGRGPILFRQTRVGREGRAFRIYKFRTMVPDAEARKAGLRPHNDASDGLFKMEDDPRVTRVGRFLRRTSLDELPQLFNVLRGDMSLVGPRPLVLDEDERITGLDRRRLQLTPGMTGPWQILGSARVPLHEMVKLDYLYVAGWSLWIDVKILLRTIPYVFARRSM